MKKLPFVFYASLLAGCAMAPVNKVQQVPLEIVHQVPMSKDRIYQKSLEWIAENFTDSKAVIELKDKEEGSIIGKGNVSLDLPLASIPCRFTMNIAIKEGRYKATYSNFTGLYGVGPIPLEDSDKIDQVTQKVTRLDQELYEFLLTHKKDPDW